MSHTIPKAKIYNKNFKIKSLSCFKDCNIKALNITLNKCYSEVSFTKTVGLAIYKRQQRDPLCTQYS